MSKWASSIPLFKIKTNLEKNRPIFMFNLLDGGLYRKIGVTHIGYVRDGT